jgi:hypothetical protein
MSRVGGSVCTPSPHVVLVHGGAVRLIVCGKRLGFEEGHIADPSVLRVQSHRKGCQRNKLFGPDFVVPCRRGLRLTLRLQMGANAKVGAVSRLFSIPGFSAEATETML